MSYGGSETGISAYRIKVFAKLDDGQQKLLEIIMTENREKTLKKEDET